MSLLDVVNEKDKVIGQCTFEEKLANGLRTRNVIAFILDGLSKTAKLDLYARAKRSFGFGVGSSGATIVDVDTISAFQKIENHIDKYVNSLINDMTFLINMIDEKNKQLAVIKVNSVFDSLMYRENSIRLFK